MFSLSFAQGGVGGEGGEFSRSPSGGRGIRNGDGRSEEKKEACPVFLMLVKLVLREGGINIRVKKGFLA